MKNFSVTIKDRRVFVQCAYTSEEKHELETLVNQTRVIGKIAQKTGLYIVDSFEDSGILYALMVLNEQLELTSKEAALLRRLVLDT
jgi:hypothetical protein